MAERDPQQHLDHLLGLERLSASLSEREGGDYFGRDLQEARQLAATNERFRDLAIGLESPTLGARMLAVDRFFASMPPAELAAMPLPPSLAQLRAIYLSSLPT